MADLGAATTEGLNLQSRFEQLEVAIVEAHTIVDRMMPRHDEPKVPEAATPSNATDTATRCNEALGSLNSRLNNLVDRVGLVT